MFANALISRRSCLCALLLLLPALNGCGESTAAVAVKERSQFDQEVETTWKKNWDWVEGLKYLEKGGLYFDSGEPGDPTYDKSHVLPLLKRISAKHGLKWHAVVDKKNRSICLAIVGQFPDVDGVQKAVRDALEEEQKSFPVDILIQEGNRWLSIDFMSPENSKFLEDGVVKK